METTVRPASEFGKDHGLLHEVVVTGRKVGADEEFYKRLAHDEDLFRCVVGEVMGKGQSVSQTTNFVLGLEREVRYKPLGTLLEELLQGVNVEGFDPYNWLQPSVPSPAASFTLPHTIAVQTIMQRSSVMATAVSFQYPVTDRTELDELFNVHGLRPATFIELLMYCHASRGLSPHPVVALGSWWAAPGTPGWEGRMTETPLYPALLRDKRVRGLGLYNHVRDWKPETCFLAIRKEG